MNMNLQSPRYIVDKLGKRTEVILSLEEFEQLLDLAEESEDIRLADERMGEDDWVDFDEVNEQLRVSD